MIAILMDWRCSFPSSISFWSFGVKKKNYTTVLLQIPPPQNVFRWTPHEIWVKTKINLQFQLHFFRQKICSEKRNFGGRDPPILDPCRFRKSGFVKLKTIIFGYKCTQLCFRGWEIQTSWLESQKMKRNTSF